MSALQVRKLPFEFGGVDFIWNPRNPGFSVLMNVISFMAIGLEKYFCLAMRDAEPLIRDPEVREEARLFRAQEMVHSQAHRKHVAALIARYPGLSGTLDKAIAHYDALYEKESLNFHLGYAGGLEAAFTPFFKMILDNRETLFGGGDARVASLFLWHFCEEIEHRSSALMVYNDVVRRPWYKVRKLPGFYRHGSALAKMLVAEFKLHVHDVPHDVYAARPFATVPKKDLRRSMLGVLDSQMPWHDPVNQPLPAYFGEWARRFDAGEDMTKAYGRQQVQAA